ncbi:type 2 lanthipeptide synthetase LanM [Enterococcus rivorum]|uniref:type 2 lanthipeptide synthetase LanM n=1 Tax=Enterococcus rivorum TaxID=762845 RepID=UPI00362CD785
MKETILFPNFFKPFYEMLKEEMQTNISKNGDIEFLSVYDNLYQELFSLSYLTLIYELNNFRENDLLVGETSEERYEYFEKMIGKPFFLEYMEKKYPALITLMNSKLNHIIKCVKQIANAFYRDQVILEKNFGIPFRHIKDMQIGAGDSHENGQTVAILTGDFGKIVYKPTSLKNDIILNELIDQVNPILTVKLKKVKVLSRDNYGWQEYIEHAPCSSQKEMKSFYHRLGSYLSLFYVLNASDYHNENIIAAGEYPIIIDTETLITTGVDTSIENRSIYNLLHDNVLRSGLLPVQTQDSYLDIDMSGLSGGDMKSSKFEVYDIQNKGTDQMTVKRYYWRVRLTKLICHLYLEKKQM